MTLDELKILLETTQLPVAFDHFKTEQTLPYLILFASVVDGIPEYENPGYRD